MPGTSDVGRGALRPILWRWGSSRTSRPCLSCGSTPAGTTFGDGPRRWRQYRADFVRRTHIRSALAPKAAASSSCFFGFLSVHLGGSCSRETWSGIWRAVVR